MQPFAQAQPLSWRGLAIGVYALLLTAVYGQSLVRLAEILSTPAPPEKLMGAEEVMDYLGITKTTYYRLIKNGELTPRRKGRRHYYYRRDLQAALAESVRRGRV